MPRILKVYTAEQQREAVRRVRAGEMKSVVGRELGVPESTLRGWCKQEGLNKLESTSTSGMSSDDSVYTDPTDDEHTDLMSYPTESRVSSVEQQLNFNQWVDETSVKVSIIENNRRSKSHYPKVDRIAAVLRCKKDVKSKASIGRELGIPESTLRGWCKTFGSKTKATKRPRDENDFKNVEVEESADAIQHFNQPGEERIKRRRLSNSESDSFYSLSNSDIYWMMQVMQYQQLIHQPLDLSIKNQVNSKCNDDIYK